MPKLYFFILFKDYIFSLDLKHVNIVFINALELRNNIYKRFVKIINKHLIYSKYVFF